MPNSFTVVENTRNSPFDAVCRFKVSRNKGVRTTINHSTGFLIGEKHILTAAHNFAKFGWWRAGSYVVGATARFGAKEDFEVLNVPDFFRNMTYKYPGRYRRNNWPFDYCLITMNNPISDIRPFQLISGDDPPVKKGDKIMTAGYPNASTKMLKAEGEVTDIVGSVVMYDIDTETGLSGGPVWTTTERGERRVIGVHVKGEGSHGGARLIESDVRKNLRRWGHEA